MLLLDNYRLKKELIDMADRLKVSDEALNLERDRLDKVLVDLKFAEGVIDKQKKSLREKTAEIKKLAGQVRDQPSRRRKKRRQGNLSNKRKMRGLDGTMYGPFRARGNYR